MAGTPQVQRCPQCGEQPMSRTQYLLMPGTNSKCRRCGQRIQLDLSRAKLIAVIALGVAMGAAIVLLADTVLEFAIGIVIALGLGVAFDQWAWSHVAWRPAPAKPEPGRDAPAV